MRTVPTQKVDDKTVTLTLDANQAEVMRPLLENSRRLRDLISQIEACAFELVRDDPPRPNP